MRTISFLSRNFYRPLSLVEIIEEPGVDECDFSMASELKKVLRGLGTFDFCFDIERALGL